MREQRQPGERVAQRLPGGERIALDEVGRGHQRADQRERDARRAGIRAGSGSWRRAYAATGSMGRTSSATEDRTSSTRARPARARRARRRPAAHPARGAAARRGPLAAARARRGAALLARARARARRVARRRGRRLRAARRGGLPGRPPGRAHARVRGRLARRRRRAGRAPPSARRASTSGPAVPTCRCSRAPPGSPRCAGRCATPPTSGSTTATRAGRPSCARRSRATWAASAAWPAIPDAIVVTSGMAQGMALIARALVGRGRPPDRRGGSVQRAGPRAARRQRARGPCRCRWTATACASTCWRRWRRTRPSSRRPTSSRSASCSRPERRAALIDWAARTGALVLEDDYDAEYRYDRAPVGAVQGLAPDQVVYAGSVSKTLAPGAAARLARRARAPGRRAWSRPKAADDLGTPVVEQLALADFLERGELDRHLRRTRGVYRARRDALVAALARRLPDCRPAGVAAGLHLVVHLPAGTDEAAVLERGALARGRPVRARPSTASSRGRPRCCSATGGSPSPRSTPASPSWPPPYATRHELRALDLGAGRRRRRASRSTGRTRSTPGRRRSAASSSR